MGGGPRHQSKKKCRVAAAEREKVAVAEREKRQCNNARDAKTRTMTLTGERGGGGRWGGRNIIPNKHNNNNNNDNDDLNT